MSGAPTHAADSATSNTPRTPARRVVLRIGPLPQGSPELPYEDGVEAFLSEHKLAPEWLAIAQDFPGVTLKRVFFTLTPAQISDLQARATRMRPGTFDDLLRYFSVTVPTGLDPYALLSRIQDIGIVSEAYLESPPTPPPSPPGGTTTYSQDYLDSADLGIGARAVWANYANAKGEGMQFADIEQGWYIYKPPSQDGFVNHVDLLPPAGPNQPQPISMSPLWGGGCAQLWVHPHGTAVLGIIRANENATECVGIAPRSNGFCVCELRPQGGSLPDRPDAILTAAAHLQVGDVLLLEMQITENGSSNQTQLWPVETESANRNAISVATAALGIVVIEATGNGQNVVMGTAGVGDLDLKFPDLNRTTQGFLDTGAVLVAGASKAVPHDRLDDTRYGSRVDCFAWGQDVCTQSDMPLPGGACAAQPNPVGDLTNSFGSSSAASAIVAGAALVVQSLYRGARGFPASPGHVRALLSDPNTNTRPLNWPAARIGVMPNLEKIAARIVSRAVAEIYLRDFVGDTGQPNNGPLSISPDIIVRRQTVANPTAAFGPGSGQENNDMLSDVVHGQQKTYLYTRLRNSAGTASGPVSVNVFWSEVATLITPSLWHHIGADHTLPSVVVPNVLPGDVLTVSDKITWLANEVPFSGHFCFVALADCAGDPAPHPLYLGNWGAFLDFIQNNNNVTWRNFDVVYPAVQANVIPFLVTAAEDQNVQMFLEAIVDLPRGVEAVLDFPEELDKVLGRRRHGDPRAAQGIVLASDRGAPTTIALGNGAFPAGARWRCGLQLGSSGRLPVRGEVSIRQSCLVSKNEGGREIQKEVEVGRITWRFSDREPA